MKVKYVSSMIGIVAVLLSLGRIWSVAWAQKGQIEGHEPLNVSQTANSSGSLHLFPEPQVTQGDSNIVICSNSTGLKIFQISTDQSNWESRPGTFSNFWNFGGLLHGSKYFYRVITTTDTSNVVVSTQDTLAPEIQTYLLSDSTTDAIIPIRFKTWDPICGSVQKVILYYRSDSTSVWVPYDSLLIDPQRVAIAPDQAVEDSIMFDISLTSAGDGYYEFYLSGVDTAWAADNTGIVGNLKIPLVGTEKQTFTYFDTQKPGSKIFSHFLLPYYNQSQVPIGVPFSAADSANGARGYWSGLEKVTAFFNYKVNPVGPYLSQDVQFAAYSFTTKLLSVDSTFNFTPAQDGIYEFYTLAKDNFGNQEDKPQLPYPTIIFDTEVPQINQIVLQDQTSLTDTIYAAQPGWTNSSSIFVYALGMEDLLKDNFRSGVDSLLMAQNVDFTLNTQRYKVSSSEAVINYVLDSMPGKKQVFAKVFDYAKNESQAVSNTIVFDPIAPSFHEFDITTTYTTQTEISLNVQATDTVAQVGELYKLRISEDPTFPSDKTIYWQLPAQNQYAETLPFTITFTPGKHWVYGQVRDKAGNWSEVWSDSVFVTAPVQLNRLTLQDLTDPSDTLNCADPGWSDSLTVTARINYTGVLKKIILSETSSFAPTQKEYTEWESEGDSVAVVVYDHFQKVGHDTLWCQLIGPNLTDSSAVKFATIRVDTTRPWLQDFEVFHTFDDPETSYTYTDTSLVQVTTLVSVDFISGMKFWEPGLTQMFYPRFSPDTTYVIRSPGEGEKLVFCAVRDSAGNWSNPLSNSISVDKTDPVFTQFDIVTAMTTQPEISIAVEVADAVGKLFKFQLSEDPTFPPDKSVFYYLPDQNEYSGVLSFTLEPFTTGQHRIYGRVWDQAGNRSAVLVDSVEVTLPVQLHSLAILDLTDPSDVFNVADPGWSDSLVVKVQIGYHGVLKKVILSERSDFNPPRQEYSQWATEGDSIAIVEYTFQNVGQDTIWCQLLGPNLTDSSAVLFATIQVDTTAPQLQDFVMYHIIDDPETTYAYTNDLTVYVRPHVSGDFLAKMKLWEPDLAPVLYSYFTPDTTYSIRTPGEGQKQVFCAVRDSAGNWSNFRQAQIYYDVTLPILQSFQLSDLSTPGPSDSVLTDTSLVEVTLQANDAEPGKLYKFILAQNASLTANRRIYYWDSDDVQVEDDIITLAYDVNLALMQDERIEVWCRAVDNAGNISLELAQDDIFYAGPIQLQVTLYDLNDTTDTRFSPTDQVGVRIQRIAGFVENVAITDDPSAPKEFFSFPMEQGYFDTLFVFHSDSLGYTATLYCVGTNSAGRYDSTWATIRIDKVPPVISALWIEANLPRGDRSWSHRRDVEIHVSALDDYGEIARIDVSEDSAFQEFSVADIPEGYPSVEQLVSFTLSGGNGLKRVYARVYDRAEHASAILSSTIMLDLDPITVVTNHPNPFNPNIGQSTIIVVKTNGKTAVEVRIYDVFGNLVRTLSRPPGRTYYEIEWDGRNDYNEMVASGGYICVVRTDQRTIKRKIAVLK